MPQTVSSRKILAWKALNHMCGQECVDWAIGQIEAGKTDRSLLLLAGMSAPFNHFEMAAMRDRALDELGLESISRSDALRVCAAEIAADAAAGRTDLLAALRELSRICIDENYAPELYDFYLLYYAWDDLLTSHEQWYLRGATHANIETLAREALVKFAAEARAAGLL